MLTCLTRVSLFGGSFLAYDFSSLSPADFEDLSRDLIGAERGIRFEAFTAGPDEGVDGRHAKAGETTILQAKHYGGSRFSDLKRVMRNERNSIDRLCPERYILTTSFKVTKKNKAALGIEIGPWLRDESDIVGAADLNALLRSHPGVEKSHFKLWLSSTAMLERVFRAAALEHGAMTRREIEEKVLVYAPNPSFDEARMTLEKHRVLIVAGPPGVGKTTLAEMLVFAHLAEGWELVPIRSLDDGLEEISDLKKQVFYFDDFLGRISLDKSHLARTDSDLARFIKRVRKSPNARFILTTRAPIFEEARQLSEHLADKGLDLTRYLLDVGVYTRRIKARILYNHLFLSALPSGHVNALVLSGKLSKVIDHPNYNPRLIAMMTQTEHVDGIDAASYADHFVSRLNDPSQLWDIPFRKHIPRTCQHLLISLFFCNEYGAKIDVLREVFEAVHGLFSREYAIEKDPKDFAEALKILEGGFIKLSDRRVSFVNPSVRDYLSTYLSDWSLLYLLARSSVRVDFARAVWNHGERMDITHCGREIARLASEFSGFAASVATLPVRVRLQSEPQSYQSDDIGNTRRIKLLVDWWMVAPKNEFRCAVKSLAEDPVSGWDIWQDGDELVELAAKFREEGYYDQYVDADEIARLLEDAAVQIISDDYISLEDLDRIADVAEEWKRNLGETVGIAINRSIERQIEEIETTFRDTTSDSTVEEQAGIIEKLGRSAGVPPEILDRVHGLASARKAEIALEAADADPISARATSQPRFDNFDEAALRDLFAPLIRFKESVQAEGGEDC